ncbi:uncharacterized protein BP5553_08772 [Venustampulla echinocandica]|uniref:DUF7907 domain-containing protein n=1 Tax=Venustampulla echinocandica TaxID=2656787 RepID=A0A370TF72_9HELO|nr:uncharacterized protein BP5553_08772 [Venustampulla echinocandica]RDL33333.1 hypothetical protein BP5553_08772 [Venustampulla echinocandica]
MFVTSGHKTYDGWSLKAWHTGAAQADPDFVHNRGDSACLSSSKLILDIGYPGALLADPQDINYGRWESVYISARQGPQGEGWAWKLNSNEELVIDSPF